MIERSLAPPSSCSAEDDRFQEGKVGPADANFDISQVGTVPGAKHPTSNQTVTTSLYKTLQYLILLESATSCEHYFNFHFLAHPKDASDLETVVLSEVEEKLPTRLLPLTLSTRYLILAQRGQPARG